MLEIHIYIIFRSSLLLPKEKITLDWICLTVAFIVLNQQAYQPLFFHSTDKQ